MEASDELDLMQDETWHYDLNSWIDHFGVLVRLSEDVRMMLIDVLGWHVVTDLQTIIYDVETLQILQDNLSSEDYDQLLGLAGSAFPPNIVQVYQEEKAAGSVTADQMTQQVRDEEEEAFKRQKRKKLCQKFLGMRIEGQTSVDIAFVLETTPRMKRVLPTIIQEINAFVEVVLAHEDIVLRVMVITFHEGIEKVDVLDPPVSLSLLQEFFTAIELKDTPVVDLLHPLFVASSKQWTAETRILYLAAASPSLPPYRCPDPFPSSLSVLTSSPCLSHPVGLQAEEVMSSLRSKAIQFFYANMPEAAEDWREVENGRREAWGGEEEEVGEGESLPYLIPSLPFPISLQPILGDPAPQSDVLEGVEEDVVSCIRRVSPSLLPVHPVPLLEVLSQYNLLAGEPAPYLQEGRLHLTEMVRTVSISVSRSCSGFNSGSSSSSPLDDSHEFKEEGSRCANGTGVRRMRRRRRSRKYRREEVVIDRSMPDWETRPEERAMIFRMTTPESLEALIKEEDDRCVEDFPDTSAVIIFKMAALPFATGEMRKAYYGRIIKHERLNAPSDGGLREVNDADADWTTKMVELSTFLSEDSVHPNNSIHNKEPIYRDVIIKESMMISARHKTKRDYEAFLVCHRAAKYLSSLFSQQCPENCPKIRYVEAHIIQCADRDKGDAPYRIIEEAFVWERFEKYNNNTGHVAHNPSPMTGVNHKAVQCFSHWTDFITQGQILVVDCQGGYNSDKNSFLLTDPAVHCPDITKFGGTNLGIKGNQRFFETHVCNEYCLAMGLAVPVHHMKMGNARYIVNDSLS